MPLPAWPTHADVQYGDESPTQRLDLYLPPSAESVPPLMVLIHGGAFMHGSKHTPELVFTVPFMLERGFAVASIGYRLSGEAPFPAGVRDCRRAVAWLHQHGPELGYDGSRTVLFGASAGAYLAVMLAVTGGRAVPFDDETCDYSVAAVIDWFAPVRFSEMDRHNAIAPPRDVPGNPPVMAHDAPDSPESLWLGAPIQTVPEIARQSDPTQYIPTAQTLPRFLIVHGDGDALVPHLQSVVLTDALAEAGADVELDILEGYAHGGSGWVEHQLPRSLDWAVRAIGL